MISYVYIDYLTYKLSPAQHEAYTLPIPQAIGLGTSIKYLENIDMDNINDFEHDMYTYLYYKLISVTSVTMLGPKEGEECTALTLFIYNGVHPS